ncbi:MAG: HlyD family efflux transporter periplasmic adaptor subunit [Chromatiaceae bacterium]
MTDQTQKNDQDEEGASIPWRKRHRKLLLGVLASIFVVSGLLYGAYWYFTARHWVSTADAYVHGNQDPLMPQVSGIVTAVRADDTELVHEGDVLVELDATDARLALDRAEATLADTVRQVRKLFQQVDEQAATVRLRKADLAQAYKDYQRAQGLEKTHNISQQGYQHALTAWETAQSSLSEAQFQLRALQAVTQGTDVRDHPQVKLAVVALRQAYVNLERTRIRAPVTGYVAQRTVQVGQQVSPGQGLLVIIPLDQVWVAANFKETDLAQMRVGQPARLTADVYGGGVRYRGTVLGISPGTGSVFELLPPQNATGNFIKVVQRVPVRIGLRAEDIKAHPLRLGLSMEVSVNVSHPSGRVLGEAPKGRKHYSTGVYRREQKKLDQLIRTIIRDNAGGKPAAPAADSDRGD